MLKGQVTIMAGMPKPPTSLILFSGRKPTNAIHALRERQGPAAVAVCGRKVDERPLFWASTRSSVECKSCAAKVSA